MRRFKSLQLVIILLIIVVGIVPCLFLKAGIIRRYQNNSLEQRTTDMQNQCMVLANTLSKKGLLSNDMRKDLSSFQDIDSGINTLSNIYTGQILIVDRTFNVVFDSYDLDTGKTVISPEIIHCFDGNNTSNYNQEDKYLEVTVPVMDGKGSSIIGVIYMCASTDSIEVRISELNRLLNLVLLVICAVVILASVLISVGILRPVKRARETLRHQAEGIEVGDDLEVKTYSEVEDIVGSMNEMLTRAKALDESRQEFVSNVSHELKTPITSMKVLADSLIAQEGNVPVELYQEFMNDIAEEIDREDKIIEDLLTLVRLDKKTSELNIEKVNLNDMVEKLLKRLHPLAEEKNIDMVMETLRPVIAEVDEVKLNLALSNLIENAIKYNKDGGWVHVSLNADHKYFYIKVADSGMGIPLEEQDHIFERFYRGDKSHSTTISGTGLGLAIARNAVVMHKGSIKVYSEEGKGTTFTIRIPLTNN